MEPAGLFCSDDRGESFAQIAGLRAHPTRPEWMPGAGGLTLNSIVPHPDGQVVGGNSSAGVFATEDGGASWAPRNTGMRCDYNAEDQKYPEFGQCVL